MYLKQSEIQHHLSLIPLKTVYMYMFESHIPGTGKNQQIAVVYFAPCSWV